jgi:hypothetical protein
VSRGRVGVRRGGTTGGVGEDNCAGRGDDAQDGRRQGGRWRSPRSRGGQRGGGKAPEVGAGRGGSRPRSGGRRWRTGGVAGARASADFGRLAAVENPVGQRTGGAAEGGGRGG